MSFIILADYIFVIIGFDFFVGFAHEIEITLTNPHQLKDENRKEIVLTVRLVKCDLHAE